MCPLYRADLFDRVYDDLDAIVTASQNRDPGVTLDLYAFDYERQVHVGMPRNGASDEASLDIQLAPCPKGHKCPTVSPAFKDECLALLDATRKSNPSERTAVSAFLEGAAGTTGSVKATAKTYALALAVAPQGAFSLLGGALYERFLRQDSGPPRGYVRAVRKLLGSPSNDWLVYQERHPGSSIHFPWSRAYRKHWYSQNGAGRLLCLSGSCAQRDGSSVYVVRPLAHAGKFLGIAFVRTLNPGKRLLLDFLRHSDLAAARIYQGLLDELRAIIPDSPSADIPWEFVRQIGRFESVLFAQDWRFLQGEAKLRKLVAFSRTSKWELPSSPTKWEENSATPDLLQTHSGPITSEWINTCIASLRAHHHVCRSDVDALTSCRQLPASPIPGFSCESVLLVPYSQPSPGVIALVLSEKLTEPQKLKRTRDLSELVEDCYRRSHSLKPGQSAASTAALMMLHSELPHFQRILEASKMAVEGIDPIADERTSRTIEAMAKALEKLLFPHTSAGGLDLHDVWQWMAASKKQEHLEGLKARLQSAFELLENSQEKLRGDTLLAGTEPGEVFSGHPLTDRAKQMLKSVLGGDWTESKPPFVDNNGALLPLLKALSKKRVWWGYVDIAREGDCANRIVAASAQEYLLLSTKQDIENKYPDRWLSGLLGALRFFRVSGLSRTPSAPAKATAQGANFQDVNYDSATLNLAVTRDSWTSPGCAEAILNRARTPTAPGNETIEFLRVARAVTVLWHAGDAGQPSELAALPDWYAAKCAALLEKATAGGIHEASTEAISLPLPPLHSVYW